MVTSVFGRRPSFPRRMVRAPRSVQAEAAADKVMEFLRTGKSHKVKEIAKAVELPERRVKKILSFLAEADLIEKNFRITRLALKFLKLPTST